MAILTVSPSAPPAFARVHALSSAGRLPAYKCARRTAHSWAYEGGAAAPQAIGARSAPIPRPATHSLPIASSSRPAAYQEQPAHHRHTRPDRACKQQLRMRLCAVRATLGHRNVLRATAAIVACAVGRVGVGRDALAGVWRGRRDGAALVRYVLELSADGSVPLAPAHAAGALIGCRRVATADLARRRRALCASPAMCGNRAARAPETRCSSHRERADSARTRRWHNSAHDRDVTPQPG